MSQLDLSSSESIRSLDWSDPVLMMYVIWTLKQQLDASEATIEDLQTRKRIIVPAKHKRPKTLSCPGLLSYFVDCCNEVWGQGDRLSVEYWSTIPIKMHSFMKGNALSATQYKEFIDYIVQTAIGDEQPPGVNILMSRGLLQAFRAKQLAFLNAAKENPAGLPGTPKLPDTLR